MSKKISAPDLLFFLVFIISLTGFEPAISQDSTYKSAIPVFIQSSLFYDFPQSYGITAALDYPFRSLRKSRTLRDGSLFTRRKDRFWQVAAAVFRYPYNYTGILLMPAIGARRYVHRSFFYETSLAIGVLRTFYDGRVYAVDASGNVSKKSLYGRFYATTHLSSAFNYMLQKPGNNIVAIQIKPSLWFQYPFDSFVKPHISLEAGIKYELSKRYTRTTRILKHVKK